MPIFTIAQRTALTNAIALGVRKVKYGDKETEYHSLAEMMQLLELMNVDIDGKPTLAQRRKIAIYRSTTNRT